MPAPAAKIASAESGPEFGATSPTSGRWGNRNILDEWRAPRKLGFALKADSMADLVEIAVRVAFGAVKSLESVSLPGQLKFPAFVTK